MLDKDTLALFENPKVEQTEMSYKCLCCTANLIQSYMEFQVQKKLVKNNNMSLVAELRIYRQEDKALEFFVQDRLL